MDPDGDVLGMYWDFGDGNYAFNDSEVTHAFELEVEESHWNKVYRAIEYIKHEKVKKTRTSPEDALNNALGDFNWEVIDGSNGSTESQELL